MDSCSVFGFSSDLERVELLYTSLLLQATSQMVRLRPAWLGESVRAYRSSWLYGYAAAVHLRLEAAEKKAEQQAPSHVDVTGASTDLVLLDRNTQVQHADLGARRIDRQRRALGD